MGNNKKSAVGAFGEGSKECSQWDPRDLLNSVKLSTDVFLL